MKVAAIIFWLTGFALVLALIALQGFSKVGAALAQSGWGLPAMVGFYLIPLIANSLSWRFLFAKKSRLPLETLIWVRWIGASVNNLLPVAQVGGDFLRARLIHLRGVAGAEAGASVVVDVTVAIAAQIVFVFIGVVLFVAYYGFGHTVNVAALGILLFSLLIFGFYLAQRFGLFFKLAHNLEKVVQIGDWKRITGGALSLDKAIDAAYRRRGDFLCAGLLRMSGLVLGTGEILLALFFLGHPISLVEAVMLEGMMFAVSNAAFMIPGALGVQEGGFMILGSILGLQPETGLALALLIRVRGFCTGLPALLFWQMIEGRHFFKKYKKAV